MPRLTILMYHRVHETLAASQYPKNFVSPDRFADQIDALLSWGHTPVTFHDWLDYRARRRAMPRRPFIVTFDDGYADFTENAWPVLRAQSITPTVFLVAALIGRTNEWDANEPAAPLLDAQQVRDLDREGVDFGGHGMTHVALARVSLNEARDEISRCFGTLSGLLGKRPRTFAYPFSNQNRAVRKLVHDAGFQCAVRGKGRLNGRWVDPFGLRRIIMHDAITVTDLRKTLTRLRWTIT